MRAGSTPGRGPCPSRLESIDIHGAGIEVVVSEDGKVNLIEFLAVMAEKSQSRSSGAGERR